MPIFSKKTLNRSWVRGTCKVLFVLGFFALLNWVFLSPYIKAWPLVSVDHSGHVAMGEMYANEIFPSLWGWTHTWLGGMPFPQFYTPLFFWLMALIFKILPFSYPDIYTVVVFLLSIATPYLIGNLAEYYIGKKYFWPTSLMSVLILSTYSGYLWGVTVQSTFQVGFVPQLFAFVVYLLWLKIFLKRERNTRSYITSTVLFACTLISNTFIVPVAVATFIIGVGTQLLPKFNRDKFLDLLKYYGSSFCIACALVSVWYLPMLPIRDYMSTRAGFYILPSSFWLISVCIVSLIVMSIVQAKKVKNYPWFVISVIVGALFIGAIINLRDIIPSIPIQNHRYVGPLFALLPLPFFFLIQHFFHQGKVRVAIIVASLTIAGCAFWWIAAFPFGINQWSDQLDIGKSVVTFLEQQKNLEGRILVEPGYGQGMEGRIANFYALRTKASKGLESSYSIFTEPTASSLFFVPLRNSIGIRPDPTTNASPLFPDSDYANQPIDWHLEQAEKLGIRYFLMHTPYIIKRMSVSQKLKIISSDNEWTLFEMATPVSLAEIPSYEPILTFSPVIIGYRDTTSIDFIRLTEESWIDHKNNLIFVAPQQTNIDLSNDFENFKTLLITDYKYTNLSSAYEKLKQFALKNDVILYPSDDALFKMLQSLPENYKVHIPVLSHIKDPKPPYNRSQIIEFVRFVNTYNKPTKDLNHRKILSFQKSNTSIEVEISTSTNKQLTPVLIKTSYFPSWENVSGGSVYMVSPTFMLTFSPESQEKVHFIFGKSLAYFTGTVVSLIGVLALVLCAFLITF